MNENFYDKIKNSFEDLIARGVDFLPKLLVALLLLLVGIIVAKLVSKWIGKGLEYLENSNVYKKFLSKIGVKVVSVSSVVSLLAKWTVLVIFFSAVVDVLEISALTNIFQSVLDFLPNLFAAALIAGFSFFAGNVVQDIVYETAKKARIGAYSVLSVASKVVILVFGLPLAASQLGLDLSIINNNLTLIVAGVMLALGLAFGLGGRDVAAKIVNDLYEKSKR